MPEHVHVKGLAYNPKTAEGGRRTGREDLALDDRGTESRVGFPNEVAGSGGWPRGWSCDGERAGGPKNLDLKCHATMDPTSSQASSMIGLI